ncbi:MAG: hypothetical protein KF691_13720 [Phycisphaeraceae bacterium]|nr:hypothetical protein [Phycisphaeraceae bacterium]
MRAMMTVLAVSATCSFAAASQFSVPMNQTIGGTPGPMPAVQTDNVQPDTMSVIAVPAPGSAVMALGGLALLARRRREK